MTRERERQLERTREALAAKEDEAGAKPGKPIRSADRSPGEKSVRAENTRQVKKAADK